MRNDYVVKCIIVLSYKNNIMKDFFTHFDRIEMKTLFLDNTLLYLELH